jgi:hypothetical protein
MKVVTCADVVVNLHVGKTGEGAIFLATLRSPPTLPNMNIDRHCSDK